MISYTLINLVSSVGEFFEVLCRAVITKSAYILAWVSFRASHIRFFKKKKYHNFVFSGEMSLKMIAELLKNAPVLP